MQIEELYELYRKYPKINTDSRKTIKDSIFIALQGQTYDGNQFADEALNSGAKYAVVSEKQVIKGNQYILVEDTLQTLQDLASYHREKLSIPILAVTGSNGKTTTKELIRSILSQRFQVGATTGNLNNHIGVPLTVLSITRSHQIGIVEMGANHLGEIRHLCKIAQPDYGLITNIGKAHLEGFGSIEGVLKAKGELYEYLSGKEGTVFVNNEDADLTGMLSAYAGKIIYYGNGPDSICTGEIKETNPFLNVTITVGKSDITNSLFQSQLVGRYNLENILAAVCAGYYYGLSERELRKGVGEYIPDNYRSQFIQTSANKLFMDAYNANPASVQVALANFEKEPDKNKVIILGEMLELGDYALDEHQQVVHQIKSGDYNQVFLVGEIFRRLKLPENFVVFSGVGEMSDHLKQHPLIDSSILIKGSRMVGLERLISLL